MEGNYFYMLEGHVAVPVPYEDWAPQDIEIRRVAEDTIGDVWISTVFIMINHALGDDKPQLFETMIFRTDDHESTDFTQRYATWEEAEATHRLIVDVLRRALAHPHDRRDTP